MEKGKITEMSVETEKKVEFLQFEKTPLQIVVDGEKGFVQLGGYRISPVFDTYQKCVNWIKKNNLELITTIIGIVGDAIINNNLKFKKDE